MKVLRWLIPFAVLALLLSVGAMAVSAAESNPVGAPFVDNATHVINGNTTTWYRFDYAGNHSQITIRLVNAKDAGLAFQVYTPTLMDEWWKHDGVGAGSLKENDLLWTGNAPEQGIWYIKLINKNLAPVSFQLVVTGSDVAFGPILPAITTLSPTTPSVNNIDPNLAFLADATARVIPAKTALWYRYYYEGDHSQVTVNVPQGAYNRLRFHVHPPTQMTKWWDILPIGQSSNSGDDLVWNGNSHEKGWWYIEVINDNPYAIGFALKVTGAQVSFGGPTVPVVPPELPKIAPSLENADPNKAFTVDANYRTIPAKTTLWYRFAYAGTHDQAILKVVDGSKNQLRVHVHTPDQMKTWWDVNPIGQATPQGDNLVWSGNTHEGGWWYVEVMNDSTTAVNFQMLLEIQLRNIQ